MKNSSLGGWKVGIDVMLRSFGLYPEGHGNEIEFEAANVER